MPEGLACASLKFMEAMNLCFDDLNDGWDRKWCYVLHDNILIGGFSDDDLYQKMKRAQCLLEVRKNEHWAG